MEIGIVTDEISQDPEAAVWIGRRDWGIEKFELRVIEGRRVPGISEAQVDTLERLRADYGVSYTALSAGLFKCEPTEEAIREQHERARRAIALAKRLGIRVVTGFALIDFEMERSSDLRAIVAPHFREVCRRMAEEGLVFAVETEYMSGVETARDARELIDAVPGLRLNWDPANAWVAGEDPLDGYPLIKDLIANIHCKDADTRDWRSRNPFVAFGDGAVPWAALIERLLADRVAAPLTVETHIDPLIPKSAQSVARLRALLERLGGGEEAAR